MSPPSDVTACIVPLTECAPLRLMMGASRLLVRLTLRTRPFWRSSPDTTSWLRGGVFERARFTSWPSPGGDGPLFDMVDREPELWSTKVTVPAVTCQYIQSSVFIATQPRCPAAHLTASRLPFATSTPNHITRDAVVQSPNKNGNPCQLSCVLSMIAWTTYGPTMDEARLERPNKPKNCACTGQH